MLIQFSLTNYKNFKETATLDLSEAKITEFPQHLYRSSLDGLGILSMVSVYGPNGSGKSNLLKGLVHLRDLVLDAPKAMDESCQFSFDAASKKSPVEYEIMFRTEDWEYDYQLKLSQGTVAEEYLFGRHISQPSYDVLFDRDSEGVFLCQTWEETDVSELTDQLPLLYFLCLHKKDDELSSIHSFFQNIEYLSGHQAKKEALESLIKSKIKKEELLSHLSALDLDITDVRSSSRGIVITHTIQKKQAEFAWEEESAGIRQLLCLLAAILASRENGSLLLVDDPETHLHPKALGYLYRLAGNTQDAETGSQLLTATHETSNMNNGLFRRDEIWLAEKNGDGSSSLYTLALYLKENGEKVRKDETYFKQYLEGRYGADPAIR